MNCKRNRTVGRKRGSARAAKKKVFFFWSFLVEVDNENQILRNRRPIEREREPSRKSLSSLLFSSLLFSFFFPFNHGHALPDRGSRDPARRLLRSRPRGAPRDGEEERKKRREEKEKRERLISGSIDSFFSSSFDLFSLNLFLLLSPPLPPQTIRPPPSPGPARRTASPREGSTAASRSGPRRGRARAPLGPFIKIWLRIKIKTRRGPSPRSGSRARPPKPRPQMLPLLLLPGPAPRASIGWRGTRGSLRSSRWPLTTALP